MPRPMDAASRFDRRNTPLTRLLDAVPDDAWDRPSPCAGWSAADVVHRLLVHEGGLRAAVPEELIDHAAHHDHHAAVSATKGANE